MIAVAFLHQKGGTGKSTLALGCAAALAGGGARVLVIDADYQGTSSDWGNRWAGRFGFEVRSQVQPIMEREVERFRATVDWLLIDGPPSLSEMTESIVRACHRLVIPVRPALPDVWALPWFAAILEKQRRAGHAPRATVVFNQHRGEPLEPLQAEVARHGLAVHPQPIPADPAFPALFAGEPLPPHLSALLLGLLEAT